MTGSRRRRPGVRARPARLRVLAGAASAGASPSAPSDSACAVPAFAAVDLPRPPRRRRRRAGAAVAGSPAGASGSAAGASVASAFAAAGLRRRRRDGPPFALEDSFVGACCCCLGRGFGSAFALAVAAPVLSAWSAGLPPVDPGAEARALPRPPRRRRRLGLAAVPPSAGAAAGPTSLTSSLANVRSFLHLEAGGDG